MATSDERAPAIRPEQPADADEIDRVVAAAFGGQVVSHMVSEIRSSPHFVPQWSLVAEQDGEITGHVLVSYVRLRGSDLERPVPCLSPLAVTPSRQRSGIGSALVRAVTRFVDAAGEPLIVLEGDPRYYARFGFEHSVPLGVHITLPDWAPPEAAQVLRLRAYDPAFRGQVIYSPAIAAASGR